MREKEKKRNSETEKSGRVKRVIERKSGDENEGTE